MRVWGSDSNSKNRPSHYEYMSLNQFPWIAFFETSKPQDSNRIAQQIIALRALLVYPVLEHEKKNWSDEKKTIRF